MSLRSPTVINTVRKDFSRSLEMTTTVISNKVRDLAFPMFEGFADGGDESWFTWSEPAFIVLLLRCSQQSDENLDRRYWMMQISSPAREFG